MKALIIYLAVLILSIQLKAQKDFETETIRILPESELNITGSTNVNKFNCKFDISEIAGIQSVSYTQEDQYIKLQNLVFNLKIKAFDCGNKRMNSDFQDLLMGDKYPDICIEIDRLEPFSKESTRAYIKVYLAGKVNHYDLPVLTNDNQLKGKFKVNILDFGLQPPKKALGLIEVNEMIWIEFDLKVIALNKSSVFVKL